MGEIIMSNKNVKELSLEEYVKLLNGKGHQVNDVNLQNQNELELYTDILKTDDLQKRILFSFPNNNDENNIINDDKDNGENKDKGKVEVKNLDDLINIRSNIVNELLKQDRKKYPDPVLQKEENEEKKDNNPVVGFFQAVFSNKRLVLPKDFDLNSLEVMNQCDKLQISSDDQEYILDGFMKGFSFEQLSILTQENQPNENFVKLCVILWRFMKIDKTIWHDAYSYRSDVIEKLTYDSNTHRTILCALLNKIATVPNINLAFATMKQVNIDDMKLRNTVKEDFKNFVATLRECNLKIVIKNNHMKAVRDRGLSLKKLALVLGSAITGILTIIFIYNLIHAFIPISLGISILLLVTAAVCNIVFAIINIRKKIFHIPCIHTKTCEKDCNLDFDLDCYDYPENEKPEIKMPKRQGRLIN